MIKLVCHPATPGRAIDAMSVALERRPNGMITLEYSVTGDIGALRFAPEGDPERVDGLWQHSCFEMFARASCEIEYTEFNLAPSHQWAAYQFDNYREGSRKADIDQPPEIESRRMDRRFELSAQIQLPKTLIDRDLEIGLSAVIEDKSRDKSYWALVHPSQKPDFHHKDCFVLHLKAATAP